MVFRARHDSVTLQEHNSTTRVITTTWALEAHSWALETASSQTLGAFSSAATDTFFFFSPFSFPVSNPGPSAALHLSARQMRSTYCTSLFFQVPPQGFHYWCITSAATWIWGLCCMAHKRLAPNNKGHVETIFQEMSKSSLLNLMKVEFWRVKVQLLREVFQVALLQWPEQVGAGDHLLLFAQWLICV